jgi:hypothetical protein
LQAESCGGAFEPGLDSALQPAACATKRPVASVCIFSIFFFVSFSSSWQSLPIVNALAGVYFILRLEGLACASSPHRFNTSTQPYESSHLTVGEIPNRAAGLEAYRDMPSGMHQLFTSKR